MNERPPTSVPVPDRRDGWRSLWPRTRIRRPLDVARLPVAVSILLALLLLALLDADALRWVADLLPVVPDGAARVLLSAANVAASLAVIGVLVTVAVDVLNSRRFAFVSALSACALSVLAEYAMAGLVELVSGEDTAHLLLGPTGESAGVPVTAAVALAMGADLQHRRVGPMRLSLVTAVACNISLGSLTLPGAAFAGVVGATAGLAVRVGMGVVPSRPSTEVVRAVVARAGWPVTELRPLQDLAGAARFAGVLEGAPDLHIAVVDPDRSGVPLARRAWRLARLRTAAVGRPALSLRGQMERQALTAALAQAAGVVTPEVLALLPTGPALVLVERPVEGTPLARTTVAEATAAAAGTFAALKQLHDAGLAHGAVSASSVVLRPGGGGGFGNLGSAQPAATELQRELDVIALLVALALHIGVPQAVAALREGYASGADTESRLAALLQPLALPRQVRRDVRGTAVLEELRAEVEGEQHGAAAPTAPRLERLRPRTVLTVVGGSIAAYVLATQLSRISLTAALRDADARWLVVAAMGSAVTYAGSAIVKRAFAPIALPLGRTALVQLASSFLTLVTPPTVGHLGLNIRYLQRAGVPLAAATATVALSEAATIAVTVVLLLVCGWLSGVSGSRLALLPSGDVLTVLVAAGAVLALVAVAPFSRHLVRRRIEPALRRTLPQLISVASDPRRLARAMAGVLLLNGGYVLALDASLRAFSESIAAPSLVVVYLAASTLGSAAPTPGGLGAVEAALVGGLTAVGVPVSSALTAVLVFRAATFWLPAPLGWGAFVWLQRRNRI